MTNWDILGGRNTIFRAKLTHFSKLLYETKSEADKLKTGQKLGRQPYAGTIMGQMTNWDILGHFGRSYHYFSGKINPFFQFTL